MIVNAVIKGGSEKSRLPEGYKKVDYIQSTGTQYIDTGFIPNQDTRVVWEGEWKASSSATWLFGVRKAATDHGFTMLTTGGTFRSDYGNTSGVTFSDNITTAYKIDKNKNVTTINDAETLSTTYETFECPKTLKLFACDTNGTVAGYSSAKTTIYQIYDNDVLVRDYEACYRESDGAGGLYDHVNDVFYGNDGKGAFSYPGSAKVATGTATTNSSGVVKVSGLGFTPTHVVLATITPEWQRDIASTYDTTGYYYDGEAVTIALTLTLSAGGFSVKSTATSSIFGPLNGTYRWVAWVE